MSDKDPIDDAIKATEPRLDPPEPKVMRWDAQNLPPDEMMTIVVPINFTVGQFEACIAVLVQMRATAVQRAQASQIVIPKVGILGPDGSPIQ